MDKFEPLVSIVIPVYNGENYVKEAIDSALAQTYKKLEIIVINDGSTDKTDEIVRSYGNKLRYFKKKNGGTSTALNLAVKNMKGDYFSWLSHDDMYYPGKIKRQIQELAKIKNKNTIMMSDLDGINEKYEKIYQTDFAKHIKSYPLREKSLIHPVIYNQTHGCTLLISKAVFEKVGKFDEKWLVAHDFEFFYRAFLQFPHKLIPEVLVRARDSSTRQGRSKNSLRIVEYSNLFISIIKSLTEEDIKYLAKDKLSFYYDMQDFFQCTGYQKALEFINKKIVKNLQITSYDLVGNRFNGYDLHHYLRGQAIDSKLLVLNKESNDPNTYAYDFNSKDSTKELLKQKIFYDTDIVHLQLIQNILDLNYLPLMTRLKPTVLSMHDPFFLSGHCVHHFDCMKWKSHCKDCPYLDETFVIYTDDTALRFELKKQAIQNSQISTIVASKWMLEKVKQSPIWKDKKIYFLPFGVNQSIFKPAETKQVRLNLNISDDATVLMFRADHGSYKNLGIIKNALSKLKSEKPIVLITVGNKSLLNEFKSKYKIIEYDWINDDGLMVSLYQASDIFLMPSRQETFGMMAIEAMSCGKLVLALNSEGSALPEVIHSPECGLAVKEEDYVDELQKLICNPQEIKRRGKKSLEFAKKNYSKDIYVERLVDIYKEVIDNHHPDNSAKLVLAQLKKYFNSKSLLTVNQSIYGNDGRSIPPVNLLLLNKILSEPTRIKMRIYLLILFYKVDKVFPYFVRMKVKITNAGKAILLLLWGNTMTF